VANVGADSSWTGHHFAQANWYAFGRLAWDPALPSDAIADEWARMTWSNDARVVSTVKAMMLGSWRAAVNYMTPLGLPFTIEGGEHYEPDPEGREGSFWHADSATIGYDRSSRGSGYVSQYAAPLRRLLDDPATTDLDELLWFHRARWDRRLPTGRTVWEELVYRSYLGARYVDFLEEAWLALAPDVDPQRWREVKERLDAQRAHARVWRDANVGYFQSRSGLAIPAEARALAGADTTGEAP
jgi:alpha-glucuronidase